jgi:glycosyltransferase involved in cell wall biosynthesis
LTITHASPANAGAGRETKPFVTVIVAAWNAAGTVERALDSVLAERSVALEIVVVDDGSTDETTRIVSRIVARDGRVVLVRSPHNEGASGAFNRGLDAASGEWLTFVGADDRMLPGGLRAMAAAARASDALAVVAQRVWTDGRRTWITPFYDLPDIREPGRKSLASAPGLVYHASGTAKLFHHSVGAGLRFEGRVGGDQAWTLRALLRAGDRIDVIGDVVYEGTRLVPGNTMGKPASLTTRTRQSTQWAPEVVAVAERSLVEVAEEAGRYIADPSLRRAFLARYVERILRADLSMHIKYALDREDPDMAILFTSIEEFVSSTPPDLVAGSAALGHAILVRPLRRWHRVPAQARRAYWSLLAAARKADPAIVTRDSDPFGRLALRVLGPGADGPRRLLATAILRAASLPRWLVARASRRQRSGVASSPEDADP